MPMYIVLIELVPATLVGLVGGLWLSIRNFRKFEKATPHAGNLLLSWREGPIRDLVNEPKFGQIVVCDAIANILLSITINLVIAHMLRIDPNGPVRALGYAGGYTIFLWWVGITYAWCWVGVSLHFLVRSIRARFVEVTVFEDGVKGGAAFVEWKRFGGYRIKSAERQIELFSPHDERLVLFTLQPADAEQFEALKQIIPAKVATSTIKRRITHRTASISLALFIGVASVLILFNPSYIGAVLACGLAWLFPDARRVIYKYYGIV